MLDNKADWYSTFGADISTKTENNKLYWCNETVTGNLINIMHLKHRVSVLYWCISDNIYPYFCFDSYLMITAALVRLIHSSFNNSTSFQLNSVDYKNLRLWTLWMDGRYIYSLMSYSCSQTFYTPIINHKVSWRNSLYSWGFMRMN